MKRVLALLALLLLLAARPTQTVGVEAWHDSAVPQEMFVPIWTAGVVTPAPTVHQAPTPSPRQGGAPTPAVDRLLTESGARKASAYRLVATLRAQVSPPYSTISGVSSWYRYVPGGAAAGPRLRSALGPDWRGSVVLVDGIPVTLSDWCGCPGGRVIDLDSRTFSQIAPLSKGLQEVTIRW